MSKNKATICTVSEIPVAENTFVNLFFAIITNYDKHNVIRFDVIYVTKSKKGYQVLVSNKGDKLG